MKQARQNKNFRKLWGDELKEGNFEHVHTRYTVLSKNSFNLRIRKEYDRSVRAASLSIRYFNPRTREECDRCCLKNLRWHYYFNPRTREECDAVKIVDCVPVFVISTHALVKSATLSIRHRSLFLCYFNPRTREECD